MSRLNIWVCMSLGSVISHFASAVSWQEVATVVTYIGMTLSMHWVCNRGRA